MLNTVSWESPLSVWLPEVQEPQIVDDVSVAAALLAEQWPVTHGKAYQHALATCARVREGKCAAAVARRAFLDAAHEAGVRVLR
ncbi:DUF982 domain-containing protein [Sinorhizobium sp. BG8]|uniref:DUF982 domain-containing protein n=1 Tax=Sinorhizobium sp. BG8 TaxID=2613773 RepID=UPI00193D51F4|nr:DUF982 domain-containing protein [Sinorhizobium sp. BG8]